MSILPSVGEVAVESRRLRMAIKEDARLAVRDNSRLNERVVSILAPVRAKLDVGTFAEADLRGLVLTSARHHCSNGNHRRARYSGPGRDR